MFYSLGLSAIVFSSLPVFQTCWALCMYLLQTTFQFCMQVCSLAVEEALLWVVLKGIPIGAELHSLDAIVHDA